MNRDQWQRAKLLLEEAIALDTSEREAFLDQSCQGDSELRREMHSLLSSHDQVETGFLNEPAVNLDLGPANAANVRNLRIGVYQVIEEIGRGGMGEVYRAARADGQYNKEVAIKLVPGGSGALLERFRHERQILASLEHPNIARLLDGGTTDAGVPYLVMELIEGTRINLYCEQHDLSVTERLQLFLQVCAAVQFAHQRLIIHRDIKPGNILVTQGGIPKLLDFGIAKILDASDPSQAEFTQTMDRLLTPQYASPEQVKGEPITTASDVYSLGVVLYELLTGRSPYPATSTSSQDVVRAVCEFEPLKPSTAVRLAAKLGHAGDSRSARETQLGSRQRQAKHLRGDLDNIVLMALRKESQRRYISVEQFAEDIRRNLGNLPVVARKDTARYRASKFVARHRAGVAAALAVALILIAGLIITVRERRIAERRFNDLRSLANALIFDVHDSVKDLPGSTPARKIIIDRSLQYLNGLAQESTGDVSLQRELASAYERVGLVQGDYLQNNLGDSKGALASYQKALEIRKQIKAASDDWNDQLALAQAYRLVANQQWALGHSNIAREYIDRAIAISDELNKARASDSKILYELGFDHEVSGTIGYPGDRLENQKIIESFHRALSADEAAAKLQPDDVRILHGYATGLKNIGSFLEATDPRAALTYYEQALEINRKLTQRSTEVQYARSVAIAYGQIASVYDDLGDYSRALENNLKGLELYRELNKADPKNVLVRQGLAIAYLNTATGWARTGKTREGLQYSSEGLGIMRPLVASSPQNVVQRSILGAMLAARGTILLSAKQPDAALTELGNARSLYESLQPGKTDKSTDVAACNVKMGEAAALAGRDQMAADYFQQALSIVEPAVATQDPDLDALYVAADAYSGLGELDMKRAQRPGQAFTQRRSHWLEARSWYSKSLNTWRRIEHPNRTAPNSFEVGDPAMVAKKLKLTESALSPATNR